MLPRIVRINGGLGNQLFQYCFGKKLEKELNTSIYFDITELNKLNGRRKLELKYFNFFEEDKHKFVCQKSSKYPLNLCYKLYSKTGLFYKDSITTNKPGFYRGYYQNLKFLSYFEENESSFLINPDYIYKTDIDYGENSLALHIRGTDYIKASIYPCLDTSYYEKAINYFHKHYDITSIYILTDDPVYASSIIPKKYSPQIISSGSSIGDFSILNSFKNIIIANSTFSLWAAYIGKANKNIVGPLTWTEKTNQELILPSNWIKF